MCFCVFRPKGARKKKTMFFLGLQTHTGLSERWRIFVDCNPLAVMALMLVLAASEHLGELNLEGLDLEGVDTLRCGCLIFFPKLPCGPCDLVSKKDKANHLHEFGQSPFCR